MMMEYYIVVNDRREGPFTKDELRNFNITRDTLVWRTGMPDWVKATDLPELADLFIVDVNATEANAAENTDCGWYAMINGNRIGPASISELLNRGLTPDTPVWHNGLHDWVPASTQVEIASALNSNRPPHFGPYGQAPDFSRNPQYGQTRDYSANGNYGPQPDFSRNPQYGQQGYSGNGQYGGGNNYGGNNNYNNNNFNRNGAPARTNWLPWAIIATVAGFLCSCIGAIFGIIAIVQANKANDLYAAGYDEQADSANNSAKIMTIVGLVLAALGLVASVSILRNGGIFEFI